jgi:hypothetical protein
MSHADQSVDTCGGVAKKATGPKLGNSVRRRGDEPCRLKRGDVRSSRRRRRPEHLKKNEDLQLKILVSTRG